MTIWQKIKAFFSIKPKRIQNNTFATGGVVTLPTDWKSSRISTDTVLRANALRGMRPEVRKAFSAPYGRTARPLPVAPRRRTEDDDNFASSMAMNMLLMQNIGMPNSAVLAPTIVSGNGGDFGGGGASGDYETCSPAPAPTYEAPEPESCRVESPAPSPSYESSYSSPSPSPSYESSSSSSYSSSDSGSSYSSSDSSSSSSGSYD